MQEYIILTKIHNNYKLQNCISAIKNNKPVADNGGLPVVPVVTRSEH